MNVTTILILLAGTCGMMIPMLLQSGKYGIAKWKIPPVALVLTVVGTLSTYAWFFIENFNFGGRSFFGAVFFVPIVFLAVAPLFKLPYGQLVDLCAPAECVMLSFMKVQCLTAGCCAGRTLFVTELGEIVRFPSQIVELVAAYAVAITLLLLSFKAEHREKIYPWYLILYGASRFVLNFFREEWEVYSGGKPPLGTIWSLVAIAVGILWIYLYNKKKNRLSE